jgi:multidrug efflux system membrane fusion protein
LDQATANLAQNQAALGQAKANLARDTAQNKYTEANATRYAELFQAAWSPRTSPNSCARPPMPPARRWPRTRRRLSARQANIGASKAAIDNARVQLGYTSIRSPIDGRTGNLSVKQGNVVMANSQELVTINQVEPIYVTFAVPEAQLPAIKRYMAERKLAVRAGPQDNPEDEETGVLTFIDNSVDMTTGTIKLKGTFPNSDRKLWPGQFVRVTLRLTTQPNAIVVPNQAVQTGQNGSLFTW